MKRTSLIIATALLLPISCLATDSFGYYKPQAMTNFVTCENFVAAQNACRQGDCLKLNAFHQWMFGYITAYNVHTPDTYDITGGKGVDFLDNWLEGFCKKNPWMDFSVAVDNLTVGLYPNRIKTSPKP